MKIALCCPASLPATQFGGILFLCVDLAREFSKNDNQVTIFTTDMDFANNPKTFNKNLPKEEKFDNFLIKRTHVWFSFALYFLNFGMYNQMLKEEMDIIHTIGIRSFQSFVAALIAKKKKIPLIIADQGGLTTHPNLKTSGIITKILYILQKPMIKFIINQSSKIIVANEYEKRIFLEFTDKSKINIIKNGINLDQFKIEKNDLRKKFGINYPFILFLGRFNEVKGIDLLLLAIKHVKEKISEENFRIIIMGVDFGYQEKMMRTIKKFEIENLIKVIKNPTRNEVIEAYSECEFLVLPSRWELSPLTPLEGFVFKKPVISTNAHGIPHTIKDKENCILVESENYEQLGNEIIELFRDKNKIQKLGENGFQQIQTECNSKIMSNEVFKLYKKILNEFNSTQNK
ncbi:glycosyltransferase family 4 protein [Nitrosopumilus sp.]|nr:glycosyltransferase family 4 protein [Nitrosopumilus sp.]